MGQFQNKLVTPYNRNFGNLEEMIIQLYQIGITTCEIAAIIKKIYGCYYSTQTISNITQVATEEVDVTFITVKRVTAQKRLFMF